MTKNKDYLFVSVQLVLIAAWFYCWWKSVSPLHVASSLRMIGLVLAGIGVVYVIWPVIQIRRAITMFPTPKENAVLMTTGAFRWMRHPIYSGIILGSIGLGLYFGSAGMLIIAAGLWILFYFKTQYEEKRLIEKFSAYADYKKKTGRFFPFL